MYTGLIVTSTSPLHHSSSVHHSTNPTVANKNLTLHPPQCFAGPLSHHIWDDKPMKSVITVCAHFKYGDIDGFHYSECKLSIRYGYFRPLEWRITRGTDTSDTSIFKSVRVKIANQRHRETLCLQGMEDETVWHQLHSHYHKWRAQSLKRLCCSNLHMFASL